MLNEISYEEFESQMNAIKDMVDFQEEFSSLVSKYGGDCFSLPTYIDGAVNLLALVTEDKEEWIAYYVFETDFARSAWYEGNIYVDSNVIPLKTVEDLWNILCIRKQTEKAGEEGGD